MKMLDGGSREQGPAIGVGLELFEGFWSEESDREKERDGVLRVYTLSTSYFETRSRAETAPLAGPRMLWDPPRRSRHEAGIPNPFAADPHF